MNLRAGQRGEETFSSLKLHTQKAAGTTSVLSSAESWSGAFSPLDAGLLRQHSTSLC